MVEAGIIDPTEILTQKEPIENIVEAYKQFDLRESGGLKLQLSLSLILLFIKDLVNHS